MSLDLPWETGWDLLRTLRANTELSATPVIAASRQTTSDPIQRSFKLGANGYIRKPFDGAQVVKRIDLVMREFYL
jgi:DNA-binding response OmpR family regulator